MTSTFLVIAAILFFIGSMLILFPGLLIMKEKDSTDMEMSISGVISYLLFLAFSCFPESAETFVARVLGVAFILGAAYFAYMAQTQNNTTPGSQVTPPAQEVPVR